MNSKKLNLFFTKLFIISLAIAPAFALGEGNRNVLLIAVMCIAPIIVVVYKQFYRIDFWIISFAFTLAIGPVLLHPETLRWSTILYSWMFCFSFMAYYRLIKSGYLTIENYSKILKFLILAYFVVLLVQQICVLAGLPVFNLSNYNPAEPWKLNSLSAEPSHSARIVALLMFCYLSVTEIIQQKKYSFSNDFMKDKWVWFAFFWTMLTMGSGTAFLFIPIVLIKVVQRKNILPLLVLLIFLFLIMSQFGFTSLDRTYAVFQATLTLDSESIIEADHSASFRIVPIIVLFSMLSFSSMNGWFGHGIDYVSTILYKFIPGGGTEVSGGGIIAMAIENGALPFILFILINIIILRTKKDRLLIFLLWFFLVFFNAINTQIVWLCIFLLFTNTFFLQKMKKIKFHNNSYE